MGHGCHDCGCPNGCECTCDRCGKRAPYGCDCPAALQARQAKHLMAVAAVAAALPVDHEMDARVTRALNNAHKGEKTYPLMRLSDVDVSSIEWVLAALRKDLLPGYEEVDCYYNAIAFFERILARYKKAT